MVAGARAMISVRPSAFVPSPAGGTLAFSGAPKVRRSEREGGTVQVRAWRGGASAGALLTGFLIGFLAMALLAGAAPRDARAGGGSPADLDSRIGALRLAGKFGEAQTLAEQYAAETRDRFGEDSLEHANALHSLAETLYAQSRFMDAEPVYQRVLKIREPALGPGHEDVLSTLAMLANVYRSTGRPQLAEPVLARILAEQEKAADPDLSAIADTLSSLAALKIGMKRYSDAEADIERALALSETAGSDPTQRASLIGVLAQSKRGQGDLDGAASDLKRALALHETAAQAGDPDLLAQAAHINTLAQLAGISQQLNRFDVADDLIEQVAVLSEKMLGPDHPIVAGSLEAIASTYERQGRLAAAEAKRRRAIEIYEAAYGKTDINVAQALKALGNLCAQQYRFDEAAVLLDHALSIAEAKLAPGDPALFDYIASVGELHMFLAQWDDADRYLTRALATLEKAQGQEPEAHAAQSVRVLRNLAYLSDLTDRYQDGRHYLEQALETSERVFGAEHDATGDTVSALAVHALGENRLDEAQTLFERARRISEKAGRESRSYANTVAGSGLVAFKRGAWAEAYEAMKQASATYIAIEQRAAGGTAVQLRRDATRPVAYDELFLSQALAAYRLAAAEPRRASVLGDEAFQLAQRTQNSQAGEALTLMAARFAAGSDALSAVMRERQDLVGEWQGLDVLLTAALVTPPDQRDGLKEQALRARRAEVASRIDGLDGRLGKEFPQYAALLSPQPLSIAAVQSSLSPREVLVFVASLPEQSLIWAIGKEVAHVALLPVGSKELSRQIAGLRCGLDSSAWRIKGSLSCASLLGFARDKSRPLPFDLFRAHALYGTLLKPVSDLIAGKDLLVVASGPLATLPLSVLVTERPSAAIPDSGEGYAEAAWLAKRHAVTTLPSVSSLGALRSAARASLATQPFVGFGNPLLTGRDGTNRAAWSKTSCPKSIMRELMSAVAPDLPFVAVMPFRGGLGDIGVLRRQAPLPETADELCAVAKEVSAGPRDVHLGAEATEGAVKALDGTGALARYRIVHFATHGLLAGETESVGGGDEPSLLLTPPEIASRTDDGLLTASEVAQLKMDADWVVLSACNTAGDADGGGEALSGLARAFFYAGARALLVSHWYVDSVAAVKITTGAFAEMARDPKVGRAEALRRSMLAAIKDPTRPKTWTPASHPSVWAPFVVVGEGGGLAP